MLLSKGGGPAWKSTRAPSRAFWTSLTRPRAVIGLAIFCIMLLLWRGIRSSTDVQDFYCWGPAKSPMDMTQNEYARWNAHLQTPIVFNHHKPVEIESKSIQRVDLNPIKSTHKALLNEERVLILTPLKDAAQYLLKYFELLTELTYPHHLIDLAFLVGDSSDDTLAVLASELDRMQKRPGDVPFHSATIVEKDLHFQLSNDVKDRHGFAAQGPRRKALGKARNYLLSAALRPEHSWVFWRDVDIVESPPKILEDLMAHDKDIIVPNIWFHRIEDGVDIEGRFDYNSWVESETALKLAKTLDKDVVLAEGYKEYKTDRTYMCQMGDRHANPDEELELDGIGGVSILVKADVHRSGINFPSYAFENQAETEGFAKMAKRAGYQVIGLPNYVVWHKDTEEEPGNA
ncbi:putative ANP1 protein [Emericellopsis atlantica]|uniref:ANP1 protein n=1 Tax=Emericellopsis atlantica TaxID=2614577 RepID=A0A9P7ZEZ3_9HYPO|nr:putative ANP1 protein [Emericellopsis atlantica]KAG9250476.1 putative ANP1 protein [Emericellopsis atlantica]